MNSESYVFYESFHKQIEILNKKLGAEAAYKFYKAVSEFGLYGVMPDEEDDVWLYGFEQTITSIAKAKDRYAASVENGKKGGRPKSIDDRIVIKLKEQGLTNAEIAKEVKCSTSSVDKIVSAYRKNQKNLNENDNVNVNGNDNENENTQGFSARAENPQLSPPYESRARVLDF